MRTSDDHGAFARLRDWKSAAPWHEWTAGRRKTAWLIGGLPWALFPLGVISVFVVMFLHIGQRMSPGMEQLTMSLFILAIAGIGLGLVGMTVVFFLRRRFLWLLGPAWLATGAVQHFFSQ
jgi:hypothetical protein